MSQIILVLSVMPIYVCIFRLGRGGYSGKSDCLVLPKTCKLSWSHRMASGRDFLTHETNRSPNILLSKRQKRGGLGDLLTAHLWVITETPFEVGVIVRCSGAPTSTPPLNTGAIWNALINKGEDTRRSTTVATICLSWNKIQDGEKN